MSPTLSIVVVVVLLGLLAFFAAAETVFTSLSKARMHTLAEAGNWRARLILQLLDGRERMLGAILIGITILNILASAITTNLMIQLFGNNGVVIATAVLTVLMLLFCEIFPKSIALFHADRLALSMAPVLKIILLILLPVANLVSWLMKFTVSHLGGSFDAVALANTAEELRGMINLHQGEAAQEQEEVNYEKAMLHAILDLADISVAEVMVHRKNVVMIDASLPLEQIIEQVLSSPYTRLPLYQDDPDNVVGIVHTKLLMRQVYAQKIVLSTADILALATPAWFVPDTTNLFDQMHAFRARKEHCALVVDEYGTLKGMVTLEDILEEIVGQIDDEQDNVHQKNNLAGVQPDGTGFLVDGTTTIRDLNRELGWKLPDDDYSTLAGLVLFEAQILPEVGQSFNFFNYTFEVVARHRHQITQVRVTPCNDTDKPHD